MLWNSDPGLPSFHLITLNALGYLRIYYRERERERFGVKIPELRGDKNIRSW